MSYDGGHKRLLHDLLNGCYHNQAAKVMVPVLWQLRRPTFGMVCAVDEQPLARCPVRPNCI